MSEDKKMGHTNDHRDIPLGKPLSYYVTTTIPKEYRLAKKKDGTLILQGNFPMVKHTMGTREEEHSNEWRDLETVELDD